MDCTRCGLPTTTGRWHRDCWRAEIAYRALVSTAASDRELLAMVNEQIPAERIAYRMGLSRERVRQKISEARRRTARRKTEGIEE